MKRGKWIVATMMLALGLSAGAFAENKPWDNGGGRDRAVYTQRDTRDRVQAWNNGYRDGDDHYRDRDDYRDRDNHYRDRDHHDRDRGRRDRGDRGRDRD